MTPDEAIVAIVGRLVEDYRPERIYLFGSAARGDAGPDSDLDFYVVVPDDEPAESLNEGGNYSLLRGMGYPKDVVPWRRGDFDARAAHVRASLPARLTGGNTLDRRRSERRGVVSLPASGGEGAFRNPGVPYEPGSAEARDGLQRAEAAVTGGGAASSGSGIRERLVERENLASALQPPAT